MTRRDEYEHETNHVQIAADGDRADRYQLSDLLLTYLSPGDPARNIFTHSGIMPTTEMIEEMRHNLGLDKPFFTQYTDWIINCLKGISGSLSCCRSPLRNFYWIACGRR